VVAQALADFDKKAEALQGTTGGGGRGAASGGRGGTAGGETAAATETLASASTALAGVMNTLQAADVQPTAVQLRAIASARQIAARVMARYQMLTGPELAALNAKLKAAGIEAITPPHLVRVG